jgi:hypothetical protein
MATFAAGENTGFEPRRGRTSISMLRLSGQSRAFW